MPSRTGDRTWTRGQRDSTLRNNRLTKKAIQEKRKSAKYYITENPPVELLRNSIKNGYCPWCDTDGWKVLSLHTNWSHGISAAELRDMAFLFKTTPTCIKSISEYRAKLPHSKLNIKKAQTAPKKHHKILSAAGKVSATQRLMNIPNREQNQKKAVEASRLSNSKPHSCPVCGKVIPRATPITCSPECRKIIRQRTGAEVVASGVLHTEDAREKIRQGILARIASGDYVPPIPARPHPCPIGGTIIPKAHPITCSVKCRRIALQRASAKGQNMRVRKIPKELYPDIDRKYCEGESTTKLAREYNVSRRFISLIISKPKGTELIWV